MAALTCEIAESPSALAQGLMFRKQLEASHGMLFKFNDTMEPRFWGKNTYLPLDVAFVSPGNIITAIKHIVPMSTKMVGSNGICKMAIEANAGFFKEHGIKPGHKVVLKENLDRTRQVIEFQC